MISQSTHTHIYIYIYIVIHRQIVSLYHNSSVWLDMLDSQSWDIFSIDNKREQEFMSKNGHL